MAHRPDRPYPTPRGRRLAIAARTAAAEAAALTDHNLSVFLRVWTPIFLHGLPLDRDPDGDPSNPGNE